MGGEIITIGSDSHDPEHLGVGIEEAKSVLKIWDSAIFAHMIR